MTQLPTVAIASANFTFTILRVFLFMLDLIKTIIYVHKFFINYLSIEKDYDLFATSMSLVTMLFEIVIMHYEMVTISSRYITTANHT